jgi:uncharacterized protein (TIGR02246 family)
MTTRETRNAQGRVAASADQDKLATEGIKRFNQSVTAAFRNKDAAAMASLWTENARFLPPGSEVITGRPGVQAFWQSGFDQGACEVALESLEIKSMADGVAYEVGRNIVRVQMPDGSKIDVPGKSLCIFRRESDGVWRADVDVFNAINS